MKWLFLLLLAPTLSVFAAGPSETGRLTLPFDANWLFLKADASGGESPKFNDTDWRKLDVPHDWSIAGPFAETNKTGGAGAFLPSGVAWYRKHFTMPTDFPNACYTIEFDGVMANSDVWINGFHLGHRPNGYVSFSYDLSGHLNFGGDNVLAVRADTSEQPASRWYAGAGIYRHVRLIQTTPLSIEQWELFISTPQVSETQATIHAQVTITNKYSVSQQIFLNISILDPNKKIVGTAHTSLQTVSNLDSVLFAQDIVVRNPQLWDLEHPVLYQARIQVCGAPLEPNNIAPIENSTSTNWGSMLDEDVVSFGIRDAHFEAATGFWLNGKNFKLKGVCLHEDGGTFGTTIPLSVWEARLKTLKSLGVNAIRTAHNPPAPEFLDLCDRMGFLVMDEFFDCWTVAKNSYDYHLYFDQWSHIDERDMILRDRNHPSVIIYSVGNEIHDTTQAEKAKRILKGLVDVAHENDPTRPVTQALFRPNVSHDYDDGLADLLDVVGQNYRENEILAAHAQKPTRKILGTENTHDRKQWIAVRDNPPYAGQFLWTGIDYLGEARKWPTIGHGSGLLDRTGAIRPLARERQSWWSDAPMVSVNRRVSADDLMPTDPGYGGEERHTQVVFADWTPRNLQPHNENVEVYSNCKEVELFLNGKSLGTEPLHPDASPRNWQVPFAPGTLKAVARDEKGNVVATDELHTAGAPAKILLQADNPNVAAGWDNVDRITATIVDAQGVIVPRARDQIAFTISGPGAIAAVDNGDNSSHEPFQASERRAFDGRCVAWVRATGSGGDITFTATTPGLKSSSIVLKAIPPTNQP